MRGAGDSKFEVDRVDDKKWGEIVEKISQKSPETIAKGYDLGKVGCFVPFPPLNC